ncbi:MAG: sigma-54 dependent transcriptional regulator [Pseudomonadota bacterium]
MGTTILFIDDDETGREVARYNLTKAGYTVDMATRGDEGLERFDPARHAVVITDVRMPGVSGLDVLRQVRKRAPTLPVIVITAYGSIELAVDAMKQGATDFIGKPFNRDHLLLAVERALENAALRREVRTLRLKSRGIERPIIAASDAMQQVLHLADRVATSDASVLITGESGTGKELIARRLHVRSERVEGPFVAVSCGALPADLLESELFGHVRGAFTGATTDRTGRFRKAEGGTLFLDEVGELPLPLQAKLLRVVQERVVDVVGSDRPVEVNLRLVAATNQDLHQSVKAGNFREDLLFRLNVVEIALPPLRQRPEDIEPLVRHFVSLHAGGRELEIPDSVVAALKKRSWPGNARELQNVCERLAVLAQGSAVALADLPPAAVPEASAPSEASWPPLPADGLSLIDLERSVIARVLDFKEWNVSQAAIYLGVPRHVLVYRMEKYGLGRPQREPGDHRRS